MHFAEFFSLLSNYGITFRSYHFQWINVDTCIVISQSIIQLLQYSLVGISGVFQMLRNLTTYYVLLVTVYYWLQSMHTC